MRPFTEAEQKEVISILGFVDDGCQCYDMGGKRRIVYGVRQDYEYTCLACRARALLKALGVQKPEPAVIARPKIGPGPPNVRRPRTKAPRG